MSFDFKTAVKNARRLPPRQRAVLHGLGDGKQRKEIADDMDISAGTVAAHCKLLFLRLGVHNSREAARVAAAAKI
jgi:DNA-binding NarL/FixJ family response regulator